MKVAGERLSIALVFVGVLLLLTLVGSWWVPLSANMNMPTFQSSRPDLPNWPRHKLPDPRG